MKTWLLTWSPGGQDGWKSFRRQYRQVRSNRPANGTWNVHNTKRIAPGDRLFLLRQKVEPKGIIASAVAMGTPFAAKNWNKAKSNMTNYVKLRFDAILDAYDEVPAEPILTLDKLQRGVLDRVYWNTKRGGIEIFQEGAVSLERLWLKHLDKLAVSVLSVPIENPSDDNYPDGAFEGAERQMFVTHRKREQRLRTSKVRQVLARTGRLACEVPGCGFDFKAVYGVIGYEYTHVHHLNPLSDKTRAERTRLEDLVIVCANCHAMIHKGGACRELAEVSPRKLRPQARG